MFSLREASDRLGVPYKKVSRWVRELKLGTKLGQWAVMLTDDDIKKLESRLNGQSN